jgi:peptidoglycan hydrolase-like protein with peptidoglycan-binding domain
VADGKYDDGVKDAVTTFQRSRDIDGDEPGVYGPATRQKLESETREP